MKYPEYDSPVGIAFDAIADQIAKSTAEKIDQGVYQAIVKAGFTVDRDTMIKALQGDSERYRDAYKRGYETGYERAGEDLYSQHQVAVILAELLHDKCACNFSDVDEWLPNYCEVMSECPEPSGVACWEQYLKHRKERMEAVDE